MAIEPGQIWRNNKKGGTYRIIGLAKHSETLEDMVVYETLYDNSIAKTWVRPLAMWQEIVDINGEKKPRFEIVASSS
jgi:hypothetical protein